MNPQIPNPININENAETSTTLQNIIQKNETYKKRLENLAVGNLTVGDEAHPYYQIQKEKRA